MQRILVRLPGAKLGDFLMTTPLLAGLRTTYPQAQITLLLWPPKPGPWLTASSPLFDSTLWDDAAGRFRGIGGVLRLSREIRSRNFDAALSLHSGSRSAWAFRWAGIPLRIGTTGKYYRRLFTHNIRQDRGAPDRHEVEYNFDMGRVLGVSGDPGPMRFPITDSDEATAETLLGADRRPTVVLNPTYGGSSRPWPTDRFLVVARRLVEEAGVRVAVTGLASDAPTTAPLVAALGSSALDLTGKTGVGAMAAVLRRSALHLSIDTGTSHLAAAVQTPCVTLFPSSEHWEQRIRWRPWQTEARLIGPATRCAGCLPERCHRQGVACVESITVESVAEAALASLAVPA